MMMTMMAVVSNSGESPPVMVLVVGETFLEKGVKMQCDFR